MGVDPPVGLFLLLEASLAAAEFWGVEAALALAELRGEGGVDHLVVEDGLDDVVGDLLVVEDAVNSDEVLVQVVAA